MTIYKCFILFILWINECIYINQSIYIYESINI